MVPEQRSQSETSEQYAGLTVAGMSLMRGHRKSGGGFGGRPTYQIIVKNLTKIQETSLKTSAQKAEEEPTPLVGYCDNCGGWSNNIEEVNGDFLCED